MYVFGAERQGAIMTAHQSIALIALGSNENSIWGDARETAQKAMLLAAQLSPAPANCSKLYATPAFPDPTDPPFVNAAMAITVAGDATSLFDALQDIERQAGRTRHKRWGQRTLDVDLIAFGDQVLPDAATQTAWRALSPQAQMEQTPDRLILPHPRVQDRSFVLVPLADVAPDWRHPLLGQTVTDMLAARPAAERDTVQPL